MSLHKYTSQINTPGWYAELVLWFLNTSCSSQPNFWNKFPTLSPFLTPVLNISQLAFHPAPWECSNSHQGNWWPPPMTSTWLDQRTHLLYQTKSAALGSVGRHSLLFTRVLLAFSCPSGCSSSLLCQLLHFPFKWCSSLVPWASPRPSSWFTFFFFFF